VSNSSYSRDPRMRHFPAFSSLVHFERKTKLYSRGKHTQRYASSWPSAEFCELHASVRMCREDQGVKFELFTRSSYTRLFQAFSSLVHFKGNIKHYFRGKLTQRCASTWPIANRCELRASVCTCGEDQGAKFELFTRSPYMRLFPAFSFFVHIERKIKQYFRGKFTQDFSSPWPIADFC